ncbi:MAG: type IV secretory system conjugative DNA transfer family protein, partial [Solirubrobacteraceae bacterium]
LLLALCWWGRRRLAAWGAGSPLGLPQASPRRLLRDSGSVKERTWAKPRDLRRLRVGERVPGRPYLGYIGRAPRRMLAAEREVQSLLAAPPRSGKSSGYMIPWLLEHEGHAVALSTKRDVYDATIERRRQLGQVWVYDPFGDPDSCSFTPLSEARSWHGALRTAAALAGAARAEQANAASEFWDREASILLAPLLHAAAIGGGSTALVLDQLDRRELEAPMRELEAVGAHAAAAQLSGVLARDPRNRETTVMSAGALLRAYRYPHLASARAKQLSARAFFTESQASTLYVIAAAHHQRDLQPVILALISSIYETAIEITRRHGPFDPALYLLLDEAANIAPVRDLAAWLSQCGDHGITINTSWQSIAQIDHRYGRAERDAILAASTAQIFIPPIADPTTASYISELIGQENVTTESQGKGLRGQQTLSVSQQHAASAPWLRQIPRGSALLVYRELPPAVVRAPGWWEEGRFAAGDPRGPRATDCLGGSQSPPLPRDARCESGPSTSG